MHKSKKQYYDFKWSEKINELNAIELDNTQVGCPVVHHLPLCIYVWCEKL